MAMSEERSFDLTQDFKALSRMAGRLQKMSNFNVLARLSASLTPSFALRASEGHCRRGAFILSPSKDPPAAPPKLSARTSF
jgi:hypothetical protein